jgi:hypothetical protein
MRGLPLWMLGVLGVLSVLLLIEGWADRDAAGYLPFIMGIVFALFTLAAVGGRLRGDED